MTMPEPVLVKLRDGHDVPEVAVRTIMLSLRELLAHEPIAFYELHAACQDPGHVIFGNCGDKLRERGFLNGSRPVGTVRDVVLAAVAGEGFELYLQSPLAGTPAPGEGEQ